jgi:hypothetical protein
MHKSVSKYVIFEEFWLQILSVGGGQTFSLLNPLKIRQVGFLPWNSNCSKVIFWGGQQNSKSDGSGFSELSRPNRPTGRSTWRWSIVPYWSSHEPYKVFWGWQNDCRKVGFIKAVQSRSIGGSRNFGEEYGRKRPERLDIGEIKKLWSHVGCLVTLWSAESVKKGILSWSRK